MLAVYVFLLLIVYIVAGIDFEGYDASCLSSCLSSSPFDVINPNSTIFSVENFCDALLSTVYFSCNSFDISTARCNREAVCRHTCTTKSWCYFGVGMLTNCPGDEWYPLVKRALVLQDECISSELERVNATDTSWVHDDDHVEYSVDVPHKKQNHTFHKVLDELFDGNDSWSIDRVAALWISMGFSIAFLAWLVKLGVDGNSRGILSWPRLNIESRSQFTRVPQDDMSDHSAITDRSLSRGSYFRTKYSQWTGDRRKKDIDDAYELSLSQQVISASAVEPGNVNTLRDAMLHQADVM